MRSTGKDKDALFGSAIEACSAARMQSRLESHDTALILELAERYPGDIGVLVALVLRQLTLSPGMGLFVPPGVLHAYLSGFAIEVMASSDNVLRGGLTPKRVDIDELLNLTNFRSNPPTLVQLERRSPIEQHFVTETPYFRVSCVDIGGSATFCANHRTGPEMLLCAKGSLCLVGSREANLPLATGECAWISADEDVYCLSGEGQGYRVQVGP